MPLGLLAPPAVAATRTGGTPAIVSPANGDTLAGRTATFRWSANGANVTQWRLVAGSSPGSRDRFKSGTTANARTSLTLVNLPFDGSTLHVRLSWRDDSGTWRHADTRYRTVDGRGRDPSIDAAASSNAQPTRPSEVQTTSNPGTAAEAPPRSGSALRGRDRTPPSTAWTRPILDRRYPDPVYRTGVRRVTSADDTRFDRNTYSRRQAENADGTLFLTYHGSGRYHVYRRDTLRLVRQLPVHPGGDPQWHPSRPDVLRHVAGDSAGSGDLRLYETRVGGGRPTIVADLTSRLRAVFPAAAYLSDRGEGSPSADGKRYAWIVYAASGRALGIASFDLGDDVLLGTAPVRRDLGPIDWVSASPSGRHVVAGYARGAFVHDSSLGGERRINTKTEHSDIALDRDGRDVYVSIDFEDGGWLTAVDLATLRRTRLLNLYDAGRTSIHLSGKAFDRPGWIIASTYNCRAPGAWTCDKVMAIELASNPRVVDLAHTYNCGATYWSETHASVNRQLTRVYYNSDAGRCTDKAETYELSLPRLP